MKGSNWVVLVLKFILGYRRAVGWRVSLKLAPPFIHLAVLSIVQASFYFYSQFICINYSVQIFNILIPRHTSFLPFTFPTFSCPAQRFHIQGERVRNRGDTSDTSAAIIAVLIDYDHISVISRAI